MFSWHKKHQKFLRDRKITKTELLVSGGLKTLGKSLYFDYYFTTWGPQPAQNYLRAQGLGFPKASKFITGIEDFQNMGTIIPESGNFIRSEDFHFRISGFLSILTCRSLPWKFNKKSQTSRYKIIYIGMFCLTILISYLE